MSSPIFQCKKCGQNVGRYDETVQFTHSRMYGIGPYDETSGVATLDGGMFCSRGCLGLYLALGDGEPPELPVPAVAVPDDEPF